MQRQISKLEAVLEEVKVEADKATFFSQFGTPKYVTEWQEMSRVCPHCEGRIITEEYNILNSEGYPSLQVHLHNCQEDSDHTIDPTFTSMRPYKSNGPI